MLFAFGTVRLVDALAFDRFLLAALVAAAHLLLATASVADERYELRPKPSIGAERQVRVVAEIEGELKVNADGKQLQHVPLSAKAELSYSERLLAAGDDWADVRLVRSYHDANAQISLRDAELHQTLRKERRLAVLDAKVGGASLYSPLGPLAREELELIETPGSTLPLELLLPADEVAVNDRWKLPDLVACRLLLLDAVNQQDLHGRLDSVDEGVAVISLEGKVSGAVGGVSSDVELKGMLNYDLGKRAITWLMLAYKENRAVGHAQPGFDVLTKVRMVATPAENAPGLSDASLTGLSLEPDSGQLLIDLASPAAGFQIAHDRRWRVMLERDDATILRFVDRGDLISQCNVSPRPSLPDGQQLTLEGFQADVKQVLGKSFGQIEEASQETTDTGLRVLRVVVSGAASELPVQWTYYHVSDDRGRRAALVFTLEASLVRRYPQLDAELLGSFRFLDGDQPTPAPAEKTTEQPLTSERR